jgi:hypothetical protein
MLMQFAFALGRNTGAVALLMMVVERDRSVKWKGWQADGSEGIIQTKEDHFGESRIRHNDAQFHFTENQCALPSSDG